MKHQPRQFSVFFSPQNKVAKPLARISMLTQYAHHWRASIGMDGRINQMNKCPAFTDISFKSWPDKKEHSTLTGMHHLSLWRINPDRNNIALIWSKARFEHIAKGLQKNIPAQSIAAECEAGDENINQEWRWKNYVDLERKNFLLTHNITIIFSSKNILKI